MKHERNCEYFYVRTFTALNLTISREYWPANVFRILLTATGSDMNFSITPGFANTWNGSQKYQNSNKFMDCSHVTKFRTIFSFLISARYSVIIVSMNIGQNGLWTHSARYSARHHWHNVKLNIGPILKNEKIGLNFVVCEQSLTVG